MNRGNRVLLFDLGGVLADLGEPAKAIGLELTEEEFWQSWLNSASVHAFIEQGLDAHLARGNNEARAIIARETG